VHRADHLRVRAVHAERQISRLILEAFSLLHPWVFSFTPGY
jgi:hypothetical protein